MLGEDSTNHQIHPLCCHSSDVSHGRFSLFRGLPNVSNGAFQIARVECHVRVAWRLVVSLRMSYSNDTQWHDKLSVVSVRERERERERGRERGERGERVRVRERVLEFVTPKSKLMRTLSFVSQRLLSSFVNHPASSGIQQNFMSIRV